MLSLLLNKDVKYLAVIVALGALLIGAGRRITQLTDALAAKPKIEIRTVVKTKIVERRVAGPVHVVEKIITQLDGGKVVERTIDRGQVTTETANEIVKAVARVETPGVLLNEQKLWSLTGSVNPSDMRKPTVGFSRSFGILSLGYSHDIGVNMRLNEGHHINLGIPVF